MRRQKRYARAAAIAVLAILLCTSGASAAKKVPLTIEVMRTERERQETAVSVPGEQKPRVLIYHTHTWEAYEMTEETRYTPTETWRTRDEAYNMIRIGEELAKELTLLGFEVEHDKTAFEPPNLSQAYSRSLDMLEKRIAAGENYDYILDVHRDAYSGPYNGANTAQDHGKRIAYVMMLVGKGTGATGAGFDERPDWPKNLDLAQRITDSMNALVSGVAREVKVKSGRFNQHVSTGALLIEVGNNKNTLSEALAACPVIARAFAAVHAGKASD
ncbi:MAG: stage II sporulation protein P [Clostridia bacterium]|nr:stage II sporulation protein P [Clostridia bacterium]